MPPRTTMGLILALHEIGGSYTGCATDNNGNFDPASVIDAVNAVRMHGFAQLFFFSMRREENTQSVQTAQRIITGMATDKEVLLFKECEIVGTAKDRLNCWRLDIRIVPLL